jgi:arsenate reductase-like glutaredoxin family protein
MITCTINYSVYAKSSYINSYKVKQDEILISTNHAEIHVEKNYLTKEEIYKIAQKIEEGIVKVKKYLGEKYLNFNLQEDKIKYFIKSGNFASVSTCSSGRVKLSYVKEKRSPYLHETVHVIANKYSKYTDTWLSEGLAVYLNDHLGGDPTHLNIEDNLDLLSSKIIKSKKYKDVIHYFPTAFYPTYKQRKAFYILAGSFVKFIKNKYGKENLLKIYNSVEVQDVTNRSLKQIKKDWLDYLKSFQK